MFNLVEFRDCLERAVSLLRTCGETEKVSGLFSREQIAAKLSA